MSKKSSGDPNGRAYADLMQMEISPRIPGARVKVAGARRKRLLDGLRALIESARAKWQRTVLSTAPTRGREKTAPVGIKYSLADGVPPRRRAAGEIGATSGTSQKPQQFAHRIATLRPTQSPARPELAPELINSRR